MLYAFDKTTLDTIHLFVFLKYLDLFSEMFLTFSRDWSRVHYKAYQSLELLLSSSVSQEKKKIYIYIWHLRLFQPVP